jgi:hypothetical protein
MTFRVITHEDGTIDRWQQPALAPWEVPRSDLRERRPLHPAVAAQRRAAQQRYRARQRVAREAAQLAAARNDAELPGAHDAHHVDAVSASVQKREANGGPLRARMPSREAVVAAADRAEARSRLNKT